MSEAFSRGEYEQICAVLSRFYNIIITDSGTGLVHSAMEGTLALRTRWWWWVRRRWTGVAGVEDAGLVGGARLRRAGGRCGGGVVLRPGQPGDRPRAGARHFEARCRAVVEIPYDPHLATGGRLDLSAMRDETRMAFLELGAHIADRFGTDTSAAHLLRQVAYPGSVMTRQHERGDTRAAATSPG